MHDARGVSGLQRIEHTQHQLHSFARRQGAAGAQVIGERAPGNVLEHEVGLLLVDVGFEHRHDVRVGQPAHAARLVQPVVHRRGIGAGGWLHQLDGDFSLEPRVEAQPHRRLGALAQHATQLEAAEVRRAGVR